jgi:hypothetical protein
MDPERIWREKPDEDLVEAGERLSEFTVEGERIIRAELRRRGLPDPPAPVDYCWKCGRGIYEGGPNDACVHCGEPYVEAVRARLGATEEPLVTEVVYSSRFAHEVNLVVEALEDAGIVATEGLLAPLEGDLPLGFRGSPALQRDTLYRSAHGVCVASADAVRAREIIESLPVSNEVAGGGQVQAPEGSAELGATGPPGASDAEGDDN